MSKQRAYNILRMLGGPEIPSKPVKVSDIRKYVRRQRMEHNETLHIHDGLGRLRHWQYIVWNQKEQTYTIVAEYEEPNIHYSPITEADIIPQQ